MKYEITVEQAAEMLAEIVTRRVPDPACKKCVRFTAEQGSGLGIRGECYEDPLSDCWIKLCVPCSERRPFAWAAKIAPERFVAWAASRAHGDAFLIDALKVLLPKPGFEFL